MGELLPDAIDKFINSINRRSYNVPDYSASLRVYARELLSNGRTVPEVQCALEEKYNTIKQRYKGAEGKNIPLARGSRHRKPLHRSLSEAHEDKRERPVISGEFI